MLEEWLRITNGFQTVGPEGVRTVPPTSGTPVAYAARRCACSRRRCAIRGRSSPQVPYGAPDLPALADIGAMTDLREHYARGLSIYQATLDTTPSAGSVNATDAFPAASLPDPRPAAAPVRRALADVVVISPTEDTTPSGSYRLRGSAITGLIEDPAASAALATATPDQAALFDELFRRRAEDATPAPVVAVVPFGPGDPDAPWPV